MGTPDATAEDRIRGLHARTTLPSTPTPTAEDRIRGLHARTTLTPTPGDRWVVVNATNATETPRP